MARKSWFIKFIGIGIFVFIFAKIDFTNFIKIWKEISALFLFGAMLLMIILIIAHGIKWKYILQFFSVPVRFGESISIFWLGAFIGMVTPGKIGELLKIYFLDKTGHSRLRAFLSVILDRFTDLTSLALIGIISTFFVFKWKLNFVQCLLVIFIIGVVSFLAFSHKSRFYNVVQNFVNKFIPILSNPFKKLTYENILVEWKQADKSSLWLALFLVLICWFVYFLSRYFLLVSLSIPLSFIDMAACVSMSALFTSLPVSINGIGTREASFAYLFSFFGLTLEEAVAFSLIILMSDAFTVTFGSISYYRLCSRFNLNLREDAAKVKESFLAIRDST
jgi:uncharacterized protein (TIRG00374 family)